MNEELPKGSVVVRSGNAIAPLVPTTIQEAWLFCQRMAMSYTLPESFYKVPKLPDGGKIEQVNIIEVATARAFQALQLGMEVGLPPAQAIQSILVLNGIGTIWGDSQLALVLGSGKANYIKEYVEGGEMYLDEKKSTVNRGYTWVCETHRIGDEEPFISKFTIGDAILAGLWGKKVWATHPGRMGKYKARAFCLRDKYPDVLKGLCHSTEEMNGEIIDVTPNQPKVNNAERIKQQMEAEAQRREGAKVPDGDGAKIVVAEPTEGAQEVEAPTEEKQATKEKAETEKRSLWIASTEVEIPAGYTLDDMGHMLQQHLMGMEVREDQLKCIADNVLFAGMCIKAGRQDIPDGILELVNNGMEF